MVPLLIPVISNEIFFLVSCGFLGTQYDLIKSNILFGAHIVLSLVTGSSFMSAPVGFFGAVHLLMIASLLFGITRCFGLIFVYFLY